MRYVRNIGAFVQASVADGHGTVGLAAMPGSCVMSTMALPRSWSLWNVSMTRVCGSRVKVACGFVGQNA